MLRLKCEAWSQQRNIAEALAVLEETVGGWLASVYRDGPNPRSRLSADQMRQIPELLWH
ncbi:MAG TPA: hypothetical protein VGE52_08555 [Pirellulales bacterium]